MMVSIGKKPSPGDNEFSLKIFLYVPELIFIPKCMATKFPYLAHQIYIQLNYVIIPSTIIEP